MLRFLARRALLALLVTLTVLTISFALIRLSGDLALAIAGPPSPCTGVMGLELGCCTTVEADTLAVQLAWPARNASVSGQRVSQLVKAYASPV